MEQLAAMATFFFLLVSGRRKGRGEGLAYSACIYNNRLKKTPAAMFSSVSGPDCQTEQGFHLGYTWMPMLHTLSRV